MKYTVGSGLTNHPLLEIWLREMDEWVIYRYSSY